MTVSSAPIGFGLMCKPPRPGVSKTRLAAAVGPEAAAQLSAAFLRDCAQIVSSAAALSSLRCTAFFRPQDGAREIADILGTSWQLEFADRGALGATMRDIIGGLLQACPAGAMIMGADVPLLGAHVIDRAAHALRQGDERSVVIAPSTDGGYCLIGMRSISAASVLFEELAWSTSQVLATTVERARRASLVVTLLDPQRDIDELADLHWLRDAVASAPGQAIATRSILASLVLSAQ